MLPRKLDRVQAFLAPQPMRTALQNKCVKCVRLRLKTSIPFIHMSAKTVWNCEGSFLIGRLIGLCAHR